MRRSTVTVVAGAVLALACMVGLSGAPRAAPTPAAATIAGAAAPESSLAQGRLLQRLHARRGAVQADPVRAVARNLLALEHLYLLDGRAKDVPALYRDVLTRTQNPRVRQFAYRRLARTELRPDNPDEAISTLRQSLDESLKQLP